MAAQPDPSFPHPERPDPERPDPPRPAPELAANSGLPHVHGRDLVPIRRRPPRIPNPRLERLLSEEDQLRDEIRAIDQQLLDLTERRQRLLSRVRDVHEEVRPIHQGCRGRRRRRVVNEPPLPPTAAEPVLVFGRELRALCLAFLQQAARALSLRALHAQLHRAGYAIDHHHPAKALADALGHEADAERCTRVRRGVYALSKAHAAHDEQGPPTALPDW